MKMSGNKQKIIVNIVAWISIMINQEMWNMSGEHWNVVDFVMSVDSITAWVRIGGPS